MKEKVCCKCGKNKKSTRYSETLKDYLCNPCYRKYLWKPKLVICKRCNRKLPMHAKSLCTGCYNSIFNIDKIKAHNTKKYHNISYELYKKITQKCVLCDFSKIVDLHHLDHNHKNNSESNLIGLCPNHHKLIHSLKYQKEIFEELRKIGFEVPKFNKGSDFFSK